MALLFRGGIAARDKLMLHSALSHITKHCLLPRPALPTCTLSPTVTDHTKCIMGQKSNIRCISSLRKTSLCMSRLPCNNKKVVENVTCHSSNQRLRRLSWFSKVSRRHCVEWSFPISQSAWQAGVQPLTCPVRHKSKKNQPVDSDVESDSDEDDNLDDDDFDAPAKFKVMKIHAASLRADTVISSALQIARNRLEEVFFGPGLLLNGQKMSKKSEKMDEGDYVDMVMERVEGQYKVKRIKVLRIYPEKTSTGKSLVKVRVWKSPFYVSAPDGRMG